MDLHRNYTADPIEDLYHGVLEIGSEEQKGHAVELLSLHDVTSELEECAKLRQQMLVLLASADWNYQFTPEAEEERWSIIRQNFGQAAQ